jgi:formylglycine-generating enzyme required for sulfatase activity
LQKLEYRNGLQVRPDPDFHKDMDRLIRGIRDVVTSVRKRSALHGSGTGGVVKAKPEAPARMTEPQKHSPTVSGEPPKEITNSIGMKMVLIPAGKFLMGWPKSEEDFSSFINAPRHRVRITRPFYVGATQVTQGQYRAVIGQSPSYFKGLFRKGLDDRPVERVSWHDAIAFCDKLNELEKEQLEGATYRLPTEAEWEYACRAGSTTRYSFGDDEARLGDHAWFRGNSGNKSHPVGQKRSNAWGLYDMHGNVLEWCWDAYDPAYYRKSPAVDPLGPSQADYRVVRGGGCLNYPVVCRSAYRLWDTPEKRYCDLGFRVARTLPPP